jgi:hypothetical protein
MILDISSIEDESWFGHHVVYFAIVVSSELIPLGQDRYRMSSSGGFDRGRSVDDLRVESRITGGVDMKSVVELDEHLFSGHLRKKQRRQRGVNHRGVNTLN